MVDIMDMEEIFYEAIGEAFPTFRMAGKRLLAIKIRNEVEAYEEAQQHIACVNCKGKKFKTLNESWNR